MYILLRSYLKVQGFSNQACSSLQRNPGGHIFGMSNTHGQSFLFGVTKDSWEDR